MIWIRARTRAQARRAPRECARACGPLAPWYQLEEAMLGTCARCGGPSGADAAAQAPPDQAPPMQTGQAMHYCRAATHAAHAPGAARDGRRPRHSARARASHARQSSGLGVCVIGRAMRYASGGSSRL